MNFIPNNIKENPIISLVLGYQLYRFLLFPFVCIKPFHAYDSHNHFKNVNLSSHNYHLKLGYVLKLKCLTNHILQI